MAILYTFNKYGSRAIPMYAAAETQGEVIEFKSAKSDPEFLKRVPYGKVPALITDGKLLTEETAIISYLVRNNIGGFAGDNDFNRGKVLQWVSFASSVNDLFALNMYYSQISNPEKYAKPVAEIFYGFGLRAIDYLEVTLEDKQFLVGDHPTVADYAVVGTLIPSFEYLFDSKFRNDYPNVTNHFNTITKQDLFKKIYPLDIIFADKELTYEDFIAKQEHA